MLKCDIYNEYKLYQILLTYNKLTETKNIRDL